MSNYINFIDHSTVTPDYYQRRFEHDLPETNPVKNENGTPQQQGTNWTDAAKRVTLIALPFISLYKPVGSTISLVMGTSRCVTHLSAAGISAYHKEISKSALQMFLTAIAVLALAGSILNFKIGLLISTTVDMGMSLVRAIQHLPKREYAKALEEILQTASSALYLAIMVSGSLEVLLASVLLQAAISLYQAGFELRERRWPEFVAKFAMGMIRIHQANQYVQLIQKRNAFLAFEKFVKLMQQVKKGRDAGHLIDSPLNDKGQEVVLVDAQGKEYKFGQHEHGYGQGTVKGMNLQFRTRVVDGKEIKELDFKVNHVFRDRLETLIKGLNDFTPDEMREFLVLTHSHAKGIKLEQVPFTLSTETGYTIGTGHKISLEGLGSITVGDSAQFPNLFDRVKVEMDGDKSIYECHELLSFFNLDDALRVSSADDIERIKIGQLFRVLHPKEATVFERTEEFFNLSISQLKEEIIKQAPDMQEQLKELLPKMELTEILPGRMRYSIPSLSEMVYKEGARSLVSTITGTQTDEESFDRLSAILKMGMISSEMRYSNGMMVGGLSPGADFYTGGADSTYTQLLTEKNFKEGLELDYNLYWGDIRVLFSLDALNSGTYQYHGDGFGSRRYNGFDFRGFEDMQSHYRNRPNIVDFARDEQQWGFQGGNEVMIKERIPPSMITGVVVPDEGFRNNLLGRLRQLNLVAVGQGGEESILGIPINSFIHVGRRLSESMMS